MKKDSRKYIWLVVIIAFIQLLLAGFSFLIPAINNMLSTLSNGEIIVGYISFESAVIATASAAIISGRSKNTGNATRPARTTAIHGSILSPTFFRSGIRPNHRNGRTIISVINNVSSRIIQSAPQLSHLG